MQRISACDKSVHRRCVVTALMCAFMCASLFVPPPACAWGKQKKNKNLTKTLDEKRVSAAAEKLLQKARLQRERGKKGEALEMYKQVLNLDSSITEAWLELAELYEDMNIPEKAAEMYEGGIALVEQGGYDAETLLDLYCRAAELQVQLGNWDAASGCLTKAAALSPDASRPYKIIGDIYTAKGRLEDALKSYSKAVQLDPADIGACMAFGDAALALKRFQEAQEAYNALLKLDTNRADEFAERMRALNMKPAAASQSMPTAGFKDKVEDPYSGL